MSVRANGRPGVRTALREVLTPLGASTCALLRAGPFEITLRPLAPALERLRASPRRYRVLLRLRLTTPTGARAAITAWAPDGLAARLARRAAPPG